MPEGGRKKPSTMIAAVGSLVIGVLAARGYNTGKPAADAATKPAPATSPDSPGASASDDETTPADAVTLRPLGQVIFGEKSASLKKEPTSWDDEAKGIGALPAVRCLIATIPDPVNTSISFRFDETLDAIEQSAVNRRYVLERWRFPWAEKGKAEDGKAAFKVGPNLDEIRMIQSAPGHGEKSPRSVPGEPGLIVFRAARKDGEATRELLAVFLVPETPTFGVDRMALARGLTLAEEVEAIFPEAQARPGHRHVEERGKLVEISKRSDEVGGRQVCVAGSLRKCRRIEQGTI